MEGVNGVDLGRRLRYSQHDCGAGCPAEDPMMRLARFEYDGKIGAGVLLDGDLVAPLNGGDIVALLSDAAMRDEARRVAAAATRLLPLSDVHLLAPLANPPKFIGVGFNSPDHAKEASTGQMSPRRAAWVKASEHLRQAFPSPHYPVMFNKQTSCVSGPFDPIWAPHDATTLDYEGEVALVIGRRLRRASEADAAAAIAGYTVTNDVSVREWQLDTSQMWLGKSFETHGPIGPWVVTADEVDDAKLRIRTWVNGELRQDGQLSDQTLSPARIVALISTLCTLEPGDLVATGTPAGIGAATDNFLTVGDIVRVEVSGIGCIENVVIDEPVPGAAAR